MGCGNWLGKRGDSSRLRGIGRRAGTLRNATGTGEARNNSVPMNSNQARPPEIVGKQGKRVNHCGKHGGQACAGAPGHSPPRASDRRNPSVKRHATTGKNRYSGGVLCDHAAMGRTLIGRDHYRTSLVAATSRQSLDATLFRGGTERRRALRARQHSGN